MKETEVSILQEDKRISDDKKLEQRAINFMKKIDITSYQLYPFFVLDEEGVPVFNEIKEVEAFIDEFSLDNIKELFRIYSFTDYYFINTKGIMLTYLINNPDYISFCRNKLIHSANAYYFDQLLSYKYTEVKKQCREILGITDDNYVMNVDYISDDVKDEVVQRILQSDEKVSNRLRYNYFLILARSYISFKDLFKSRGSSCLNEVFSEMYEFMNKGNKVDSQEKMIWKAVSGNISRNHSLLVLFEALKEIGYLSYGIEDVKRIGLFEGLPKTLAGMFLIDSQNHPRELTDSHIHSISKSIREEGGKVARKRNKYDYNALERILNKLINELEKVRFDRWNVYRPMDKK